MNAAPASMPEIGIDHLRPEAVMAAAAQAAGCNDFGPLDFVEGLGLYLDDLRNQSGLTPQGVVSQFQDVVRLLSNRLGFQRDVKAHPEILDEKIDKPIIILGLPRTGSSKLQRTIAADPAFQRLEVWRLMFPAPFPNTAGVEPDPRIGVAEQIEQMLKTHFPEQLAGHPMEAREPDEELWLLEMSFESPMSSHKIFAPNHRRFVERRSQRAAYAYMRQMLQYLQWQDGGARGRRWALKSPMHIGELPTVLETFPDATLVHCHRDPRAVIGSYCGLIDATWNMSMGNVDRVALSQDLLQFWAAQTRRNLAVRQGFGDGRIVDVFFKDICNDIDSVIAQIYAAAGQPVTEQGQRAMHAYTERRPEGYFGKYRYALETYGLDGAQVDAAFADYLARFPRLKADKAKS